jgi:hypothetical protein
VKAMSNPVYFLAGPEDYIVETMWKLDTTKAMRVAVEGHLRKHPRVGKSFKWAEVYHAQSGGVLQEVILGLVRTSLTGGTILQSRTPINDGCRMFYLQHNWELFRRTLRDSRGIRGFVSLLIYCLQVVALGY